MIGVDMCITIQTLWKQGRSKSEISRFTGHDRKTVHKVIKAIKDGKIRPEKKKRASILDPYQEKILELIEEDLSSVRIHEKLQALGCVAAYPTVKGYVGKIKKRENICIRFHTEPGEEAQVDFGYFGKTPDNQGKLRKTWVFNMRLSYSRLDYFEKVYDQTVETFINCHINAFNYFQGVPKYIKIDNLKAGILEAHFYEPIHQIQYKMFSEHYGFDPIPCRVRKPQEKGKTESGIKYVKNNFLAGRTFKNGDDLDKELRNWLDTRCNQRVHGTTRKIPREVFEEKEKEVLRPVIKDYYEIAIYGKRKVYQDCHVYIDYSYYSVPYEYVGKEVEVEQGRDTIRIFYEGQEIALHIRSKEKGSFTTVNEHYPKYKQITSTEYQGKYHLKMGKLGGYAEKYFLHILEKHPKNWNRPVQGILSLAKNHSNEVIDRACQRALHYGADGYRVIKNICENGSHQMPLEKEGLQ